MTYEPEFVRPELPVPLSPLRGWAAGLRRYLVGLRRPTFSRARTVTGVWATAAGCAALVSLVVPTHLRAAAVVCTVLLGCYLLVRAPALIAFERRQYAFEPEWLAEQSEILRAHRFEVLRFSVQEGGERRGYDLDRDVEVAELLARHAAEPDARVSVEFTHWMGTGGTMAVEEVLRDLAEVTVVRGEAEPGHPWVRFPDARYLGRHRPEGEPAESTFWALSGPVVIGVAAADRAADRAGTRSTR